MCSELESCAPWLKRHTLARGSARGHHWNLTPCRIHLKMYLGALRSPRQNGKAARTLDV